MKSIRLWKFTDVDIDGLIEKHIKYVTTSTYKIANIEECAICGGFGLPNTNPVEPQYVIDKKAKKSPRKVVLYHKYLFLIHQIIKLSRKREEGYITLNSQMYEDIIGEHFFDMLYLLRKEGIIDFRNSYVVGEYSRSVEMKKWNITWEDCCNIKVLEYIDRYNTIIRHHKEQKRKDFFERLYIEKNYREEFIDNYDRSLSMVRLTKVKEAIAYIKSRDFSQDQYNYYMSKIEDWKDDLGNGIINIDKNGRIYHYITNLPNDLKSFFNFKFSVDISNSHPLLFSKILMKYYHISTSILLSIRNKVIYNKDSNNIHYLREQLCNILINSKLYKSVAESIPPDALLYLLLVSKGIFWDVMLTEFGDEDRRTIKQQMFQEVFYGKALTAKPFKYANYFAEQFPSVWKVIIKTRRMDKTRTQLPNLLMQQESNLFHQIIQECFQRNWVVVSIHDAIVMLDCDENSNIQPQDVIKVVEGIYTKNNLYPSVKVE